MQKDTLLLADVFESFRNKWIVVYEIDLPHSFSAPRLKKTKTKIELELLTGFDVLLMVEKDIRDGMYQAKNWHAKAKKN